MIFSASEYIAVTVSLAKRTTAPSLSTSHRLPLQMIHFSHSGTKRMLLPWHFTNRRAFPRSVWNKVPEVAAARFLASALAMFATVLRTLSSVSGGLLYRFHARQAFNVSASVILRAWPRHHPALFVSSSVRCPSGNP